ncbi:hypothetical protein CC80DRAFT_408964 [Byssothecium circinans]|uniref:C6 transcription factor n=1 Tax=Byssothecium circinans TaxID=147558 RepID=A0A6A5U333_9PLEO|nr:hypothetical protein CC80DRAFT_408964 [Byssothecium circinans]
MVSTRQHPREFPAPDASPTKGSPRKSLRNSTASPVPSSPEPGSSPLSNAASLTKRAVSNSVAQANSSIVRATTSQGGGWSHTASNVTLLWIAISLPLVIWDALYILLRPHTMAGGKLQWPIWKPYEVYAAIDHLYGTPGWENKDGFGGGQGFLNAIEAVLYGLYGMILYNHGEFAERGSGVEAGEGVKGWLLGGAKVKGRKGNQALIIGFAAAVMTLSKTVLYYAVEYYSEFANVRHNDWPTLILFYGIMNGMWVIFPAYMTITFGADILAGLDAGTESSSKKRN